MYTPSGEYLTAISRGSVIIIEAGSMEVLYSVQLLDFEFERKSLLVSLVYASRRIACGRLEDEIGWGASWELLADTRVHHLNAMALKKLEEHHPSSRDHCI